MVGFAWLMLLQCSPRELGCPPPPGSHGACKGARVRKAHLHADVREGAYQGAGECERSGPVGATYWSLV